MWMWKALITAIVLLPVAGHADFTPKKEYPPGTMDALAKIAESAIPVVESTVDSIIKSAGIKNTKVIYDFPTRAVRMGVEDTPTVILQANFAVVDTSAQTRVGFTAFIRDLPEKKPVVRSEEWQEYRFQVNDPLLAQKKFDAYVAASVREWTTRDLFVYTRVEEFVCRKSAATKRTECKSYISLIARGCW